MDSAKTARSIEFRSAAPSVEPSLIGDWSRTLKRRRDTALLVMIFFLSFSVEINDGQLHPLLSLGSYAK
jgi:hypothetical protein